MIHLILAMLCDQTPALFSETLFSTCSTSVLLMTYFFIQYAGDLSSVLHTAAKERDSAISRLKQDINTMIKEKEIFQEECAKVIQVRNTSRIPRTYTYTV